MQNSLVGIAVAALVGAVVGLVGAASGVGVFRAGSASKKMVYATINLDQVGGRCIITTAPQTIEAYRRETIEWTIVNRCRAIENTGYVVAANQGASLRHYPPYSWPGGSQIVDYDGRLLAEASPGPGERIVVAPIDITAVRHERETRIGHHMLAHLRTEAYPVYARHQYPPAGYDPANASYERNVELIRQAKSDAEVNHGTHVPARR